MKEWLSKLVGYVTSGVKKASGWLKSIPSEPNGNGSSSRIALLAVTFTVCGLLIAFFHVHKEIPGSDVLYGLAAILTAIVGGYGINKWKSGGGDGNPPQGQ